MSLYRKIYEIYGSYFSEPYPAREIVCVKKITLVAILVIGMISFMTQKDVPDIVN